MSDDFEELLKRWLRDRAGQDRSALQALAGNVAALPPRRRQPGRLLPLVASVVVIGGLLALVSPRFGLVGGDASPSATLSSDLPAGPEAFAGDPRLGQCFGTPADMEFAFEMTRARDYDQFLPEMGISPELHVDKSALVVIYREGWEGPGVFGHPVASRSSPVPGHRFVCVVTTNGEPNLYADVSITGLTIDVVPSSLPPSASSVDPTEAPSATPEPAPAWTAGAAAVLQCDGPPAEFGAAWKRGSLYTTDRGTPELALEELAHRLNSYGVPFPTAGFTEIGRGEGVVALAHHHRGGARAVVVMRSEASAGGAVWFVDEVAVCEGSEFGPDAAAGVRSPGWIDGTGSAVPTTTLEEIPDCYFGWKLVIDGRLFVWAPINRDFEAFNPEWLEAEIGVLPVLPEGSGDTGYRSYGRELFLAPDGKAAYVVLLDGVQRWAHVIGDDYQRTDCN